MADPRNSTLPRLLRLVQSLYADSEGFEQQPENEQLWYNRGYANGMLDALEQLGFADAITDLVARDRDDPVQGQDLLSWAKAYRHGWEMGHRETHDVLPGRPPEN